MLGFLLALDRLKMRRLTTAATLIAVAVGAGLAATVESVSGGVEDALMRAGSGTDMIVGPEASALSLVLSSVLYMEPPSGTIPYGVYEDLAADMMVERAAPIALGDSVRGIPVVATTKGHPALAGNDQLGDFLESGERTAVIGADAAEILNLDVGDGVVTDHTRMHGEEPFIVAAIMDRKGTPDDRAIFVPIDEFLGEHRSGGDTPGESAEPAISAVLVNLDIPTDLFEIQRIYDEMDGIGTALPRRELGIMMRAFGDVRSVLGMLALLVILVSAVGIGTTISATLADRLREAAVLRALGASRALVFSTVLWEGAILSFGGGLLGLVSSRLGGLLCARYLESRGILITTGLLNRADPYILLVTILLGTGVALLAAVRLYRMSVAEAMRRIGA